MKLNLLDIPGGIILEVSSPGDERVVRIPQDLVQFKERSMYVKYVNEAMETGSSSAHDGISRLISFDSEANSCTWGLADVRVNREKSGKSRPLDKKQRVATEIITTLSAFSSVLF